MVCSTTLTVAQAAWLRMLWWQCVLEHDAVYGVLVMADVFGSSETSPRLPDYTSSGPICEPQNVWYNCWTVKDMKRSDCGPIWGAVRVFLEGLKKTRSSIMVIVPSTSEQYLPPRRQVTSVTSCADLFCFSPLMNPRRAVSCSQDPLDQILMNTKHTPTSFLQCPCFEDSVCGQFT